MKYQPAFYLKEPNADRETAINCHLWIQGKRFKIATGHLCHPRQWSAKKQRLKPTAMYAAVVNPFLDAFAIDVARVVVEMQRTGERLEPATIRKRFDELRPKQAPPTTAVDLLELYKGYITSPTFTEGTKKNHQKTINHLKDFATAYGLTISFDRLDTLFFDKLTRYLLTVQQMTNDSAWNILKCFKAFLNWSVEKEHAAPIAILPKVTKARVIPKGDVSEKVYLNREELDKVRALDLSSDKKLARVRDLFVFLCYTGIRYGDSQAIRPENAHNGVLTITTGKNRKVVRVPLLEPARVILERYKGRLPAISNQKANDYLEDVLKAAEINRECHSVTFVGTERRETTKPKYEVCGMHTAKRTFVSLLRQRGVSVEALMKATGNSRATLERYILREEEDAIREITEAWA